MESRGLSKLFIVNTKDLLKSILHFLNVLIISTNFWVLYRTIYNRYICSLYYFLVHFTIPCTQWCHLWVRLHYICEAPWHVLFILTSDLFETWVVLSAWSGLCSKRLQLYKTTASHIILHYAFGFGFGFGLIRYKKGKENQAEFNTLR